MKIKRIGLLSSGGDAPGLDLGLVRYRLWFLWRSLYDPHPCWCLLLGGGADGNRFQADGGAELGWCIGSGTCREGRCIYPAGRVARSIAG